MTKLGNLAQTSTTKFTHKKNCKRHDLHVSNDPNKTFECTNCGASV